MARRTKPALFARYEKQYENSEGGFSQGPDPVNALPASVHEATWTGFVLGRFVLGSPLAIIYYSSIFISTPLFMLFSQFTFRFAVPGLTNPFSEAARRSDRPENTFAPVAPSRISHRLSPSPTPTKSRKRGWEPAFAEPSYAETFTPFTLGDMDPPAKYRATQNREVDDQSIMERETAENELAPPPKRRRTLAGSIINTALSAALIGTAVGLTVYRLWRGTGSEHEQLPPPPPYEETNWVPVEQPKATHHTTPNATTASMTPKTRKIRHTPSRSSASIRQRKTHAHTRSLPHHLTRSASPASHSLLHPAPEFNFTSAEPMDEDEDDDDENMEWSAIGDKLSQLIEEGKRALGREIVVMSERPEDEVDDGTGDWVDDTPSSSRFNFTPQPSTHGSSRRATKRRSHSIASGPPSYNSSPDPSLTSPRRSRLDTPSTHLSAPAPGTARNASLDSTRSTPSTREVDVEWQSPQLREFMERARAAKLRR